MKSGSVSMKCGSVSKKKFDLKNKFNLDGRNKNSNYNLKNGKPTTQNGIRANDEEIQRTARPNNGNIEIQVQCHNSPKLDKKSNNDSCSFKN